MIGAAPRLGQFGIDSTNDAVEGVILLRKGEQAQTVLKRVEDEDARAQRLDPAEGREGRPFYDRSDSWRSPRARSKTICCAASCS